jgi:serine/threonine-protein kinase RsbW
MVPSAKQELAAMANAQISSISPRSVPSMPFVELRYSVCSQIAAISPFIGHLMRFITSFQTENGSAADIELALREALTNAVIHGNREDVNKRVYVACRCYRNGEVLITVRDEGEGFDTNAITNPTSPDKLFSDHGRGIYMMQRFMDEVYYERGGAVVRMRKSSKFAAAQKSR